MSSLGSNADPELPAVDERLVAPDTRFEIDDGKLVYVPPAFEPHANRHAKLAAVLEAHVTAEFDVAVDMLTRTSKIDDIAPDASIYPRKRDATTGGRQLEHIAFEIASTESLSHAGRKAAKLIARGVRRVFALDLEHERALEWSAALETWRILDDEPIVDPVFAVPLPIGTIIREVKADDAVARALLAKRNPVLETALDDRRAEGKAEGRLEGRIEGELAGKAAGIVEVLVARGLEPAPQERARILSERDPLRLRQWLARAATCTTIADVLHD